MEEIINITKNSGFLFFGKIFGYIFAFLFNIFIVRSLGSESYGMFVLVYTFVSFFAIILKFGLNQGLVAYIPKLKTEKKIKEIKDIINYSIIFITCISIVTVITVIIQSNNISTIFLNDIDTKHILIKMSGLIIFLSLINLLEGIYRAQNKIKYYVLGKNILVNVLKLSTYILLIIVFKNKFINSLIIAYYISIFIILIYLFKKLDSISFDFKFNIKSLGIFKKMIIFSFPLFLSDILGFAITRTDIFMIGYFLGNVDVGTYNVALKIASASTFAALSFSSMFSPVISKLYNNREYKKLEQIYTTITKWIFMISIFLLSLVILYSKELMLIFDSEFVYGNFALILLVLGQIINGISSTAGFMNVMTGNPQYEFYTNIFLLVTNVLINYWLIPLIGINGAAIASLLSFFFMGVIKILLVYKDHKWLPFSKNYLKVLFSIGLSFLIVFIIKINIHIHFIVNMIIGTFLFGIIFVLFYYWFGIDKSDQIILNKIKNKFIK